MNIYGQVTHIKLIQEKNKNKLFTLKIFFFTNCLNFDIFISNLFRNKIEKKKIEIITMYSTLSQEITNPFKRING